MFEAPPCFDVIGAQLLARELLGCAATASALPSERDQNFLLAIDGQLHLVLKIANASEDPAFLAAEQRAMQHVSQRFGLTPRVQVLRDGAVVQRATAPDGRSHLVWAVSALPGMPLARASHRAPELWQRLGAAIAELSRALDGFDDPALHRDFHWDLARGRAVVDRHRSLVEDRELGAALDALIGKFDGHTAELLA